jgi:hypothetical protein
VRVTASTLAVALALTVASSARSADPPSPPSLSVHAAPVFGQDAATGYGWNEMVVRLDNTGTSPKKGMLELANTMSYSSSSAADYGFLTQAPFNVPPGRSVLLHVPTHGFALQAATITVAGTTEDGAKISGLPINLNGSIAPLLVDVDEPSRISTVLRNATVSTTWSPFTFGGIAPNSALTVGAPTFDPTTGDPILPGNAAGYGLATVVLIHSDTLARLEQAPLEALVDWVLAGGTLAVIPARPEDLRGPALTALLGGPALPTDPPSSLFSLPAAPPVPAGGPLGPLPTPPPPESPPPTLGRRPDTRSPLQVGASPAVRPRLVGYTGGNLHPSDYGASAPYGTGEVHLLAFDPTVLPMIEDVWVHTRIVDLVGHAWNRRAVNAFRGGAIPAPDQLRDVRRALDPNENFRPALGIAAILLVIYSLVAGPLTFLRAAKKGTPLAPLKWVPIWSAAAFAGVVLIGLAAKGWRGRARHMSLIEAGAGVSRGAARRFRGFFTSEARSISIPTTDRGSVLDVTTEEATKDHRVLRLDRDGARLEGLTSLPWQTVVVVEDGFVEIRDGVTILPRADGSADVVNRTGHPLRDVIVYTPGQDITYVADLANGAHLNSSAGRTLLSNAARVTSSAGTLPVHPLVTSDLVTRLEARTAERIRSQWQPLESAASVEVDWWPDHAPVVLAEIVGGEGKKTDSGLAVESDHTMLRVVGVGGTL